ncbi:flagellar hook protein [uncultured Buchnera sp.]|jgi:flagellar hook-associated protein 1|uniref:FlgK family flagellar hook-associated protein n=1 Tax=uncultured Buchnera sp. TaxID=574037 RepID=UPI0025E84E1B|nr:flagellar hook protein [uncultured Buchnera sp.]
MSSILTSTVTGINAIKILINNTANKIINPKHKDEIQQNIFVENTADESNFNAGVRIKKVYDDYNDFIKEEKRKISERVQDEQTKIEEYLKLEDLFGEKSNIFTLLINQLYSSIENDVVNNNGNRFNENIENNLKKIISELKNFDEKLSFLEKDVKESITEKIKKANILINKIYDTNIDIKFFPTVQLPNRVDSFIDRRDQLIDELNDIIGVKVVKENNTFKVCLNNGMCIIDDHNKQNLIALTSSTDDKYISVGYWDENEKTLKKMEHMIPSSSLGALLMFRREDLQNARNKIGQLTINFADSINECHTLGYDILGNLGKQVFSISDPEIISSSTNQSYLPTSIKWVSTSDAQDTNYVVFLKNNHWTVTRLRDRSTVEADIYQLDNNTYITFDGIEFKIEGDNAEGNIYMIKPYSKTLNQLELLIVKNDLFSISSSNDLSQKNKNNAIKIHHLNQEKIVNKNETLYDSYRKFLKSISYKCNDLEEKVPFKRNMIEILKNKKISESDDIHENYQKLSYEQKCYLANVKILKMAETIFNEIVDCYS